MQQQKQPDAQPRVLAPSSGPEEMELEVHSVCQTVEKKVQAEMLAAQKVIREQAEQVGTEKVQNLSGRLEQLEKQMTSLHSLNAEVGSLKLQCKDMLSAVQEVQKTYAGLESVIEVKVTQATEVASRNLGATLESKFDALGEQLMKSVASLARKREHESGDANLEKAPRGAGGAKKWRLSTKARRHPRAKRPRKDSCAGSSHKNEEAAHEIAPTLIDDESPKSHAAQDGPKEEDPMANRVMIKLQAHPKGRRDWAIWMDSTAMVRDLYWEYARVSKRGVSKFHLLTPQGKELRMTTSLADLDETVTYLVKAGEPSESQMANLEGETAKIQDEELERDAWQQRLSQLELRVEAIEAILAAQRQAEPATINAVQAQQPNFGELSAASGSRASRRRCPAPPGLGGGHWQDELQNLLRNVSGTRDCTPESPGPLPSCSEALAQTDPANQGACTSSLSPRSSRAEFDAKKLLASTPTEKPPCKKARANMGGDFIQSVDNMDKAQAPDATTPAHMLAKQLEIESWFRDNGHDCHAFTLMCTRRSLASPEGPLSMFVMSPDLLPDRTGYYLLCMKCGLHVEPRRWKQNRGFGCKKKQPVKPRGRQVIPGMRIGLSLIKLDSMCRDSKSALILLSYLCSVNLS